MDARGEANSSVVTYAARPSLRRDPYHGQVYNGGGRPIDLSKPAPTLLASMGGNKTPWVDTAGVVPGYYAHLKLGRRSPGRGPGCPADNSRRGRGPPKLPRLGQFRRARSSQYRQVGNAVPPLLAEALARQLSRALYRDSPWLAPKWRSCSNLLSTSDTTNFALPVNGSSGYTRVQSSSTSSSCVMLSLLANRAMSSMSA